MLQKRMRLPGFQTHKQVLCSGRFTSSN
uniref:Uncharacterized protein n=1 Tax=Rhizophora mucronata TaxID=61149 RepID=A0A2P2PKP8_RHIMU